MPISPSAEDVNAFHLNSDKDSSAQALHHTLGTGPSQAAPGNHTHNGKDSARISFNDIDGGVWNIDGGEPGTVYTPIPHFDGGSVI
jgi:hypothetical protein